MEVLECVFGFLGVFGLTAWIVYLFIDGVKNPDEKKDTWRRGP